MAAFEINGVRVEPGTRTTIDIPLSRLYTHAPLTMPVQVTRGTRSGPRLFVSAALHGDELNGVEVIRRLLKLPALNRVNRIHGTLVAVPIVNVHGFIAHSRYLPDRRDLNRSFPGSDRGSLAARLADLFMTEIVNKCTHGIDLHTGAGYRTNLPQIRANLDEAETRKLAEAFGVPVLLNTTVRDGSLRQAAAERGVPMLLYEAGEALRFDELSIRAGVKGIVNVMRALGMLPATRRKSRTSSPVEARSTTWVRAAGSGVLRPLMPLGSGVTKGGLLGVIADPFGEKELEVVSPVDGIVIGRTNLPLANEGDALFHIARFRKAVDAAAKVEAFQEVLQPEPDIEPDLEGPIT